MVVALGAHPLVGIRAGERHGSARDLLFAGANRVDRPSVYRGGDSAVPTSSASRPACHAMSGPPLSKRFAWHVPIRRVEDGGSRNRTSRMPARLFLRNSTD